MKTVRRLAAGYCIILALTLLAAHWGSRAVTVIAENIPVKRQHTFIIDPGHGGVDGGATSCTGVLESRFNLEISLRLRDLMQFLGQDTKMVRTEDISVYTEGQTISEKKMSDLKNRVKLVNETENGILLSIHQNTFPDGKYSGAQIFYANTQGSQLISKNLQEALVQTLNPDSSRKEKRAIGVYLMEHIQRPGILIECGFLSNPEEEAKLRSREYQQKLCCVIACTVCKSISNT